MSVSFPILRSLDPYHQRLGYLNCVALVAGRDLDRRDALGARFHDLIFERVYQHEPRWLAWLSRATPEGQEHIQNALDMATRSDPSSILLKGYKEDGWVHAQDLWLNDSAMPSSVGSLSYDAVSSEEAKLYRPIELAKWIDLILPTYELSENGVVARCLLDKVRNQREERFNPLLVGGVKALQLLYARMFLKAECLFPVLVLQMIEVADAGRLQTSGKSGLLLITVQRLLETIGEPNDPADILELQGLLEFRDALERSNSTAENYLRPRMEILVDLGLIRRQSRHDGFVWATDDFTQRCAVEWRGLASRREHIDSYLDRRFFSSMATVHDKPATAMTDRNEILREFAIAYAEVGREFGFTPGRTVALLACINAWMKGRLVEVSTVFDVVEEAANTPVGQFLHLSGGSRFDREFLVRVGPEFVRLL